MEAFFLSMMEEDLLGPVEKPYDVFVDNQGAVALANDFVSNSRVRHYERRVLKVRELLEDAIVAVKPVGTADNASDIFSKALGRRLFEKHRRTLLNIPTGR